MAAVRGWLESRHVYVQNDWLEACINFVREDNEERQLSAVELNELVYEQWLMADIQESSLPCLPEELGSRDISKLEGYFSLQYTLKQLSERWASRCPKWRWLAINSILNVGESAYSQIQKLKGQDDPQELNYKANPSEPKIKPSRMLLLELTDGTQTVFGMEYHLIPFLKVTTPPGTKIQVTGQITCRLGALLLTPGNVTILGGNIMQLMEGNSYWNVLHQAIGLDPPEKPSVIKTESLGNEELNFNQIIIQDHAASDITTYNHDERAAVTNKRDTAACLSNTGNISEDKGQMKQQACRGRRGVGVLPANSYSNWGTGNKDKVCNQEYLDDDDDILAAVADDDYFVMEEDFDMEQIDQLEMGTQNTNSKTDRKTTTANMLSSDNNDLEMFYGDEIFEDDFVEEDLLAEATDSVEIKPLHERICNEETVRTMHSLKKPRISNSSSLEFGNHARNKSSSSNTNIQIQSDGNSSKPRGYTRTLDSVKTEPVLLMNKSTFNSCNMFINTGKLYKPKNAVAKSTVVTNPNNVHSTRPSVNQTSSIQIKNGPHNESIPSLVKNDINPMVVDTNQHYHNVHDVHGTQDQGRNSAPFEYLSEVPKDHPARDKHIVRIKAYIATLLSRPDPMSSKWNITVKLNDGTAAVDADLSEKVLTELLEYPVDKYRLEIKEAMRSRNPDLCRRLRKKTEQFERNLASTSGLMDLQFDPDTPRPRVLRLTQPTSRDVSEMIRHVSAQFW